MFATTFHVEVPSADTDLLETGMLDSLQLVELLVQIETHFDRQITIDNIELDDLRTLRGLARLITRPKGAVLKAVPKEPARASSG